MPEPKPFPLTRREFLNYAWLASLGLVFGLLGCNIPSWLLPKQEVEPIPTDYIWLGSSTIKNLGDWLTGRGGFPMGEQSWFLEDIKDHKKMFIHGKFTNEGARIQDVINWLNNPEMKRYVPEHINIFIGSNEITDYSGLDTDDKLEKEATRITEVIKIANTNFQGKKVHIILPFPTLFDQKYPNTEEKFQYERRRNIFNNAASRVIIEDTQNGLINNADCISVDEVVMMPDPNSQGNVIIDPSAFRADGRHLVGKRLERFQNVVYSKIGR